MSNEQTQSDDHASSGGEDESSTEREGNDSHLHDDQKSRTLPTATPDNGEDGERESKTKVQDLTRAGRADFDPNAGQE